MPHVFQRVVLAMIVVLAPRPAGAQQEVKAPGSVEKDHAIVFEVGPAFDISKAEGFQPGGTVAFEVTPIEGRLELESGLTAIPTGTGTEISVDLLFKKPWRISPRFEFMLGVGPEIVHASGAGRATFWGVSSVADLMFWPKPNVGWYLEPGYEVTRREGRARHGFGMAAGILIGR